MVKDVVGKVRTSTYDLPPDTHTYGALVIKDEEGVGTVVISSWDVSKPSAAKTSDRDLVKTNVLAVQNGNITAKDARLFAQAHPEIRFVPAYPSVGERGGKKRDKVQFDGPYGLKSKKMECPLSSLIEARFTDFTADDRDYPDITVLKKKFRIPPPRETKASQGHSIKSNTVAKVQPKFTMKKFQNVQGRLN
ncbi:unnamed protein product, partial [Discosporangium mesarthrocarpum]